MTTPPSLPSPLIPLNAPEAVIETVGGKGANLVKLANAGFSVPNGFLIPTVAYRELVEQNKLMSHIQSALQDLDFTSPEDLIAASEGIGTRFTSGLFPTDMIAVLEIGWQAHRRAILDC